MDTKLVQYIAALRKAEWLIAERNIAPIKIVKIGDTAPKTPKE